MKLSLFWFFLGTAALFAAALTKLPLLAVPGAAFVLLAALASNKLKQEQTREKIREARRKRPDMHERRRSYYLL